MTDANGADDYISVREFREAGGTQDWPVLSNGATTFFPTDTFATSARLVQAIAEIEGIEGHAGIDLRAGGVTVRLLTVADNWWGMSKRDVELARRISAVADDLGLTAESTGVQSVDPIIIGAVDIKLVMPFWQALMGYELRADSPDEDIVDPRGIGPGIWFEQVEGPRSERNRMHVAVWVPYEQAEARVAAAFAAGGTVILRQARAGVVDPGRPGRQRGRHRDLDEPRLAGHRRSQGSPLFATPVSRPQAAQARAVRRRRRR